MIGALGALAIESRAAPRAAGPAAQARHAAWIAGEALAACGLWVRAIDVAAAGRVVWLADADPPRVLAVIAATGALPLVDSLPWSVRTVLRVLGVPVAAVTAAAAASSPVAAGGVRIVVGDPARAAGPVTLARVVEEPTGYRVTFAPRA